MIDLYEGPLYVFYDNYSHKTQRNPIFCDMIVYVHNTIYINNLSYVNYYENVMQ